MTAVASNLFFSYRHDQNTTFIQHWAGSILNNLIYVDDIQELGQCFKKIIFISVPDANFQIDLVRQLIRQQNYLIFSDPGEICRPELKDLLADCPECKEFSFLLGGKNNQLNSFNTNLFYFSTLSDPNILRAQLFTVEQIYSTKNKPYKYLYLNGSHRNHRLELWNLLHEKNQLQHALKSYLGQGHKKDLAEHDCIPLSLLPKQYESPLSDLDKINLYQDQLKKYRTTKSEMFGGHWVDGHVIPAQYINTYFSLVTETVKNTDFLFVTEKTYKPLLAGHPFLILSSPGFYDELHRMGFETFGKLIDESFDHKENWKDRVSHIATEVERLCASDLDTFLSQAKEICVHNQQHYISSRVKAYQDIHISLNVFLNRIIDSFVNSNHS